MFTLLIAFFLLAIVISFLCSMWEAVLLSITPSYAQIKLKEGTRVGRRLQVFKENIDRPLAAILTLNTIAHTVGAVGVGNQATQIWAETNPFATSVLVPVIMTLAILVLSELIPKTLGANFWKELAPFTVKSLSLVISALFPLIWFSQFITKALKKGDKYTHVGFGTFGVVKRAAREGRNPQSGATIKIPARTVVKFSAGKALKEAV